MYSGDAARPAYGAGGLAGVMPAVARSIGVRGMGDDVLDLPAAKRAVVILADGLGDELLRRRSGHAPFLRSLLPQGRRLAAGFPSTTATSLASLGTGLPPGAHGLVGFEAYDPEAQAVFNELSWKNGPDPRSWQPFETVFEKAAATVEVTSVGSAKFDGSGLTTAALRGPGYAPAEELDAAVAATVAALRASRRALVYLYWAQIDAVGHQFGSDSWQWGDALEHFDRAVRSLAERVPAGTAIHITADHGMVDTDEQTRIDIGTTPALANGVRAVAGDARAPHVHVEPGALGDVLAAWRETLGERAVVVTREEAVASGVFGRVDKRVQARLGDIVVAMRDTYVVLDSRRHKPAMLALVGHHGALTHDEIAIPLLTVAPR